MALKKNKVKGPIFAVKISCGNLGSQKLFVYKVTEKVICVAYNELGVGYYNRETGYVKETVTGLAAVCRWVMHTKLLEDALKRYGKKSVAVYKSYEYKEGSDGRILRDENGNPIKELMTRTEEVYVYDSGWHPALNSKEERVYDVPSRNDFSDPVVWFNAQGYKVLKAY